MSEPKNAVILSARAVTKRYGSQVVLEDVDLDVRSGEILALIGENGAGKSTLMRILAGATRPDLGTIDFQGKRATVGSVRQAQALGIAMIFQELNLVPSRTVAQNIYIGREPVVAGPRGRFGVVDRKTLSQQAGRVLKIVGSKASPDTLLSDLSVGQQQLVEIAKAISFEAKVLFMDEPTSSLSEEVASNLLTLMRGLSRQGMAVVFTTHRLPEAFQVADRFVVVRDGRVVGRVPASEANEAGIVEMMVGRPMNQHYPKFPTPIEREPRLEVLGLSGGIVRDVTFSIRPGEILGFAGLVGAGRTELARLIFGAERPTAGEIRLDGKSTLNRSPAQAIGRGIGFVPEDRKKDSLVLQHSVRENMILAGLGKLADHWDRSIATCRQGYATLRGKARDPLAFLRPAHRRAERRQSAEMRAEPLADPLQQGLDPRRADAGHRCRSQGNHLSIDRRPGESGRRDHVYLVRSAGGSWNERPDRGDVRGPRHGNP